jgi:hypothetical protein
MSLGAGLLAASGYLFKNVFQPSQLTDHETKTIEALLATLIPDDETPGALKLGVADKITSKAAKEPQYRRIIRKGSAWLDKAAGKLNSKRFVDLQEDERDSMIAIALKKDADALPGIFIKLMRSDAFKYYYGNLLSWPQLGYAGPPQPNGFPDYADIPQPRS